MSPSAATSFEDAQEYLTGSLAVRLETDAGIAQSLLDIELFDLGLDYLLRYPGLIRGVTPEQIGAAAVAVPAVGRVHGRDGRAGVTGRHRDRARAREGGAR